jgi:hypothetical protein
MPAAAFRAKNNGLQDGYLLKSVLVVPTRIELVSKV